MKPLIFFVLILFFVYFFDVFGIKKPYFRDILAGTDEIHFVYKNSKDTTRTDTTILKNKRLINDFTREITEDFLKIEAKNQIYETKYKKSAIKIIFFRKKFKITLAKSFVFKEKKASFITFLYKNHCYTQNFSIIQQNILDTAIDFPEFLREL